MPMPIGAAYKTICPPWWEGIKSIDSFVLFDVLHTCQQFFGYDM